MRPNKLIALILLIGILILLPVIIRNSYYLHLLIMVGINTVLAMTFIFLLRTGLISIAIAGFWGIGAYTSALLTVKWGVSFWLALPTSAIMTGIIAFLSGYVLVKKGGIGFVILTLVFAFIITLIFGTFEVFGGYVGIYNIPRPEPISIPFLNSMKFTSKTSFYYLMLFLVFIVILVFSAFYAAWTGRAWRAIGLNPRLAESLGINIFKYRLLAFVITATATGLIGSFFAHYYGSIVPTTFGPFKTLYLQVYAILGGVEFAILGPLIGSLIMTLIPEFLRITREVEPIFTGIIVVLLVIFLPDGLLGLLRRRQQQSPAKNISNWVRWARTLLPIKK